jgi:sugar phosphate isomerase/epimerase
MRVLIETLENDVATFERIAEFKTAAQIANIGICYDTGHGEMEGSADAIHLNDSKGDNDDHLWPFEGKRDWPALIERLVQTSFNGPLVLEASDDRFERATSAQSRLRDLWAEAENSIEEFRLKYKLPEPRQEDEE